MQVADKERKMEKFGRYSSQSLWYSKMLTFFSCVPCKTEMKQSIMTDNNQVAAVTRIRESYFFKASRTPTPSSSWLWLAANTCSALMWAHFGGSWWWGHFQRPPHWQTVWGQAHSASGSYATRVKKSLPSCVCWRWSLPAVSRLHAATARYSDWSWGDLQLPPQLYQVCTTSG